jgi:beta-phosphoglucomutase
VKLTAVIWDLDGTLIDTEQLHYQAWRQTMAKWGIDYPFERFATGFGRNNLEILAEQMPSLSAAMAMELSEDKELAYRLLLKPGAIDPMPGTLAWLEQFHTLKLPQIVGSSAPMANIIAMVNVLNIGDYFNGMLSGYRIPRGKPDPLLFLRCAAAAEATPQTCLVIEDSIHGIEAAHRAAMPSIAVGKLARTAAVQPYVQSSSPPCLAVDSLDHVNLTQIEELFFS